MRAYLWRMTRPAPTRGMRGALGKAAATSQGASCRVPPIHNACRSGLQTRTADGIQQGMEEGILQGEATVLLRLLKRRCGRRLSEVRRERLEQASPEELETWAD